MKVKSVSIPNVSEALKVLAPLVTGIDLKELLMLNIVLFRVHRSRPCFGENNHDYTTDGINFKIDRRDIVVTPGRYHSNTRTVDSLRFGIRKTNDGYLDMGKLAKKFNNNMEDILKIVEHEKENESERERLRKELNRKYDVSQSLVEEGLLDPMTDSIEETATDYRITMLLESDEELRLAAEFYKSIKDSREVTA